jgi:hypothetical protein
VVALAEAVAVQTGQYSAQVVQEFLGKVMLVVVEYLVLQVMPLAVGAVREL